MSIPWNSTAALMKCCQKNLPDTESLQLVIDAAPITDTYMSNDEVRRMDRIMLVLSLALLFITTLNYVLITIASLSKRAKSIGIPNATVPEAPPLFSMFIIETLMVLGCALVLMVILTLVFGDMIKDTINITPTQMLEPSRLWVPISVMVIFVLIGGIIPGRIFSHIPVSNIFRRFQLAPQSVDAHAALRRVCRRHIHCVHDDRSRFAIS